MTMAVVLFLSQLIITVSGDASLHRSHYVTPLNSLDSSYHQSVPYQHNALPQSYSHHVIKSLPPMFYGLPKFQPEVFGAQYEQEHLRPDEYQSRSTPAPPYQDDFHPSQYFGPSTPSPLYHQPYEFSYNSPQYSKPKAIHFAPYKPEPYKPTPRSFTPKPFYHSPTPQPYHHEPYHYGPSVKPYHSEPTIKPHHYGPSAKPSPEPHHASSPSPYHGSPYHLEFTTTVPRPRIEFKPFVYHGPSSPAAPVNNLQKISSEHDETEENMIKTHDEKTPVTVTQRNYNPDIPQPSSSPLYLSITTPAPAHPASPFYGPYHQVTPTPAAPVDHVPESHPDPGRAPRLLHHNHDIIRHVTSEGNGALKEEAEEFNELDIVRLGSPSHQDNYHPVLHHSNHPGQHHLHHVPPKPAISFIDPPAPAFNFLPTTPALRPTPTTPAPMIRDTTPAPVIASEPLVLNPNILFRKSQMMKHESSHSQRVTTTTTKPQTARKMIQRQSKSSKISSSSRNSLIRSSLRDKQQSSDRDKQTKSKSAALLRLMEIAGDNWDTAAGETGNSIVRTRGHVTRFQCPESEGHFPDPEDCSVYYQCAQNTPHRRQCDTGLQWSTQTNMCDWEDNVTCVTGNRNILLK